MSNTNRFLHFKFRPQQLNKVREIIESDFKNYEDEILNLRKKYKLPRLLETIRNIKLEKISELMESLSKMDVLLLIYEYPFHKENKETKKKINIILGELYISIVGRTAWNLFQHDTEDFFLQELLYLSYEKDKTNFIGIESEFQKPMDNAFQSKKGIIKGLVPYLKKTKVSTKIIFKKWKVKDKSKLETRLLLELLGSSLGEDHIIRKDGIEFVANFFEQIPSNQYKNLLKVYLEARKYKQYHFRIMEQAILRLMDPREKEAEWNFLNQDALGQVEKWLYVNELKKFFDSDINSERFEYWKRYIDYMDNVIPMNNPLVAFIYFADFVVVEFGEMGAAYFYKREGFEKIILPRINSYKFKNTRSKSTKESMLKDQSPILKEIPLFLIKLDHRGNWQRRFSEHMSSYNRLK
ncbi:EH signature domain-containing protein [Heyndrickxia sp. MSNUG]|uniref:EH signature domain-containing protein n=1 Tax=Heyndrickxia sp. MSNUG TaxID=3136677 RepID=UPI003C2D2DA0